MVWNTATKSSKKCGISVIKESFKMTVSLKIRNIVKNSICHLTDKDERIQAYLQLLDASITQQHSAEATCQEYLGVLLPFSSA